MLAEFHRRLGEALAGLEFELILVDDGSDDGTAERLDDARRRRPARRG